MNPFKLIQFYVRAAVGMPLVYFGYGLVVLGNRILP
jgi:hypothetical protein